MSPRSLDQRAAIKRGNSGNTGVMYSAARLASPQRSPAWHPVCS